MRRFLLYFIFFAFAIFQPVLAFSASDPLEIGFTEQIESFTFSLSQQNNKVFITWNNKIPDIETFELQRSVDGKNYVDLLSSSGNSSVTTFVDELNAKDLEKEVFYYRVVITTTGGEEYISEPKSISVKNVDHLKPKIIANSGIVSFDFYSSQSAPTRIQVFNSTAGLIQSKEILAQEGANSQNLTLEDKKSGLYFLRIEQNGRVSTTKFFIR